MNKTNFKQIARNKQHAASIKSMIRAMIFEEDPNELDAYRKLIKKNVSIFRRTYLAAYFFKLLQAEGAGVGQTRGASQGRRREKRERGSSHRSYSGERPARSDKRSHNKQPIAPNVQNGIASLHINCGRLHGLTETDLRSLIDTEIDSSVTASIQDIRLYDKYVFVYLAKENAQTIIDKLTGLNKFGRRMIASYSKKNIQ